MKATVLIPVKSLQYAKSRLAKHISANQKETLVLSMLEHVIKTVKATDKELEIFIVSYDPKIIALANLLGIKCISKKISGLNSSLTYAAQQVNQDIPLLTLSADLPLLKSDDVLQILSLGKNNDIILAPSKEKTGTNAILVKKPLMIPYTFGRKSLMKFTTEIEQQSLSYKTYFDETIAFDIDTPDDIEKLKKIQ